MNASRRDKLLERKAQIDAQLKALDAKDRQKQRKDDTRRKILAGSVILAHVERDPGFAETWRSMLDAGLTRPQDRALFGLPEKSDVGGQS